MKKIFTFFALVLLSLQLTYGQETSKPFITTWTIASGDLSHSLVMTSGLDYDFSYVWRDASNAVVFSGTHTSADVNFKTTFQAAGTYTLEISGTFPHFNRTSTTNIRKLADVKQWGDIAWQSMNASFQSWPGSAFTATDVPDLTHVTDMRFMFLSSSFNQDISNWNVGSVTDMRFMFSGTAFNQDINNWNVSSVTTMSFMFYNSLFNQDISDWEVGAVTDMSGMFEASLFNQDISNWNVSSVTDMRLMFYGTAFNQDINNWNVSNVTDMSSMFSVSSFNQDISGWDVSNVTDMGFMFAASSFNQDISGWNVGNVTTMEGMFYNSAFNQDISGWNVGNVTDMESMFDGGVLSGENYDAMLVSWSNLPEIKSNVKLGVGTTTFCKSAAARNKLIDTIGWMITDGGQACSSDTAIVSLSFDTQTGEAIINSEDHSVSIEVSSAATIASLPLNLKLSPGPLVVQLVELLLILPTWLLFR